MIGFKLLLCSAVLLFGTSEGRVCEERRQDDRTYIKFDGEVGEKIGNIISECAKGVTDISEFLEIIREGKYRTDGAFQKVVHCSYEKSGFTRDDGTIKIEEASRLFPDSERMYKIMKMCNQKYESPEKTTNEYFKCFQDNTPYLISV